MVITSLKDAVSAIIEPAAAAVEMEARTTGKPFNECSENLLDMLRAELNMVGSLYTTFNGQPPAPPAPDDSKSS